MKNIKRIAITLLAGLTLASAAAPVASADTPTGKAQTSRSSWG